MTKYKSEESKKIRKLAGKLTFLMIVLLGVFMASSYSAVYFYGTGQFNDDIQQDLLETASLMYFIIGVISIVGVFIILAILINWSNKYGWVKKKKNKYNVKKYTGEDMGRVFSQVIMPHLIFMMILSIYIAFRFSETEGFIFIALSIAFSWFVNKRMGFL